LRAARRLLELCEANKGFYVKAGQFLGSMQNIPEEFRSTLSVLQDQVRMSPSIYVKLASRRHIVTGSHTMAEIILPAKRAPCLIGCFQAPSKPFRAIERVLVGDLGDEVSEM
jgi:hypothetical protein